MPPKNPSYPESAREYNRRKMKVYNARLLKKRENLPDYVPDQETAVCITCKKEQPITAFIVIGRKTLATKKRFDKTCVSCRSSRGARWANKTFENRDKLIANRRQKYIENKPQYQRANIIARLRRFGVTLEWYEEQLNSQGGKCAICSSSIPGAGKKFFCIDHKHSCCGEAFACSKCRRGLLCSRCNLKLGVLEVGNWLSLAQGYLQQFN